VTTLAAAYAAAYKGRRPRDGLPTSDCSLTAAARPLESTAQAYAHNPHHIAHRATDLLCHGIGANWHGGAAEELGSACCGDAIKLAEEASAWTAARDAAWHRVPASKLARRDGR